MWNTRIEAALLEQKAKDRYRRRPVCQTANASYKMQVEGKSYLNFSSNDYLGLAHHPLMIEAASRGAKEYGVGSGGSPHVTGYSDPLVRLEERLASWLGYDAAIVYPSGFTANQAAIKLLIEKGDVMIADRLSHASLLEAAMFSPGRLYRFKHNDPLSLESYLEKEVKSNVIPSATPSAMPPDGNLHENAGKLVITEGIFSMDGDSAPLPEIARITQKYGATLMVDDAHGVGFWGSEGRGTCDHYGIKPDILVVTFGKAFGCSGAALLLSKTFAEYFVQFSRPLIYSTAIPPMQAETLLTAIDLIASQEGDERRMRLAANIRYFRESIAHNIGDKIGLLDSISPIQPLIIGEDAAALAVSAQLKDAGIWVSAIRPPTVPPHTARLRVTITADHDEAMIDQFIARLAAVSGEQ